MLDVDDLRACFWAQEFRLFACQILAPSTVLPAICALRLRSSAAFRSSSCQFVKKMADQLAMAMAVPRAALELRVLRQSTFDLGNGR